jgi:signal peptidase
MTTTERTRRTSAGVIGDALLWVAAGAGVVCIVIVIAAVVFHVTLIMFKTGSMEPTIPTGSLAVVHQIPADQARVGDIVTVDRPGQLPVTHRVTSVTPVGSGEASITLRGDANPTDDVAPYVVKTVRIVWTWIPGWARVVVWFSNPLVLGGLTIGATALVTWAFWPRDRAAGRGRRRAERRRPQRRGRGTGTAVTGATILVAAGLLVVGAAPGAARAADVETVVSSQYLQLTSISDPDLTASMTRAVPVPWQVGVEATAPEPGVVHLGLAASGPMADPGDFTISVLACSVRWVSGSCPGSVSTWLPTSDLATAIATPTAFGAREVGSMRTSMQLWLLMNVTMTAVSPVPGNWAALRLQAWGVGDPLSTGPGRLASTGTDSGALLLPALLAFMAIGLGLGVAAIARRRGEADDG